MDSRSCPLGNRKRMNPPNVSRLCLTLLNPKGLTPRTEMWQGAEGSRTLPIPARTASAGAWLASSGQPQNHETQRVPASQSSHFHILHCQPNSQN